MTPIAIALALLTGIFLGLLGAGGSSIAVPVFMYALGMDAKQAIASSLPVVGVVALVGAIRHWRAGNLDAPAAMTFAPTAVVGAFSGARAAEFISGSVQIILFALVMMVASVLMFRDSGQDCQAKDLSSARPRFAPVWKVGIVGLGVGILTGLVGVGGGFLIVPALVLLTGLSMKRAIGTSLAVIAVNTMSGFVGYTGHVAIQWGLVGGFAAVAAGGIFVGAAMNQRVSQQRLRRGFAMFLAIVAVFVLTSQVRGQQHTPGHGSSSRGQR